MDIASNAKALERNKAYKIQFGKREVDALYLGALLAQAELVDMVEVINHNNKYKGLIG